MAGPHSATQPRRQPASATWAAIRTTASGSVFAARSSASLVRGRSAKDRPSRIAIQARGGSVVLDGRVEAPEEPVDRQAVGVDELGQGVAGSPANARPGSAGEHLRQFDHPVRAEAPEEPARLPVG